ncbi:MAG TPA: hypothetical protein VMT75_09180 [Candidatus Saccharimonadales bacterium]|nr:hypothetical protein [Candidatus Saccharimonadales bacterium]
MIQIIGVRKADQEEMPHFELIYVDLDKKEKEKGYFQTTKYGTETELRRLLKDSGVPDADIDKFFRNAIR